MLWLQEEVRGDANGVERSGKERLWVLWIQLERGGHERKSAPHAAAAVTVPARI